jgi:predicted AlkP superfamily phosphohydrolase/phosphomutase
VEQAYRREELYRGPAVESAPDIVFLNNPDYRTDSRLDPIVDRLPPASLRAHSSGDHRALGILALTGAGVFQAGVALGESCVEDVLPTLVHAIGLPVPADVDGHILRGAFESSFLNKTEERVGEPTGVARPRSEYSEEEEEGIRTALRGMGYID